MLHTKKNFGLAALAFILLSAFALSGCGKDVHYTDSKKVYVDELEESRSGDQMTLHITFINDDDGKVNHPVYRVEWMNKDGHLLNMTPWRPIVVRGGHKVRVVERSTMPGVDKYMVIISNDED